MGTLFSCFSRPRTRSTSSLKYPKPLIPTPISHPYPLATRQRAMSEYHRPSSPFAPTPPVPLSPTATHSPIRKHHSPSTTTSRCSSPGQRAVPRGPMRVHEIPFPLLISSSAPGSPRVLSPSSSLRPLAPSPRGPQVDMASISSVGGRRKLRKVQVVDGGWELWRQDDWGGYDGGASKPDDDRGRAGGAHEEGKTRGYGEAEILPLVSLPVEPDVTMRSAIKRGMRDLSGNTVVAEQHLAKEGTT